MATVSINEVTINPEHYNHPFIEIEGNKDIDVKIAETDGSSFKKFLFIGMPVKFKHHDNITHIELVKLKTKFRVNFEQVVIYKIIEKINFYDCIIVMTVGFGPSGIEFLGEIKHFFEFDRKKILIVKSKHHKNNFTIGSDSNL